MILAVHLVLVQARGAVPYLVRGRLRVRFRFRIRGRGRRGAGVGLGLGVGIGVGVGVEEGVGVGVGVGLVVPYQQRAQLRELAQLCLAVGGRECPR